MDSCINMIVKFMPLKNSRSMGKINLPFGVFDIIIPCDDKTII